MTASARSYETDLPRLKLADVLAHVKGVRRSSGGHVALCPAHEDANPSLSISEGEGGRVLLNCFAGCTPEAIAKAIGLELYQLSPSKAESFRTGSAMELLTSYDYTDADGHTVYQVCRYRVNGEKTFRQRRPDGRGGWIFDLKGVTRVPYRLPELIEGLAHDRTVFVVEGEKDADALAALGFIATTNSGGAGKWLDSYSEVFTGATVVILPDNDGPGRAHARDIERSLIGIAASVKIVELPGVPEKGDVSDWLAAGGNAEQLRELVDRNAAPQESPTFLSLEELLKRPELLVPPPVVIPRIARRGRTTLIAGADKAGKSTLLAHATAAHSKRGYFLDEPVGAETANIVWVGLEEALGDAVMRFEQLAAVPPNIQVLNVATANLLEEIRKELKRKPADVVVVDSVTEYARILKGAPPEDGDSSGWSGIVRPLTALTREFPSVCLVLLHHSRRSDGQFRSSGEIAAAVDCLLEMRGPGVGEDTSLRHITGRARWTVEPFDIKLRNGRYELAGGAALSVDARVLLHIEENRGVSLTDLRRRMSVRGKAVDDAVAELIRRGAIVDLGGSKGRSFHPAGRQKSLSLDPVPNPVPADFSASCPVSAETPCPPLSAPCPTVLTPDSDQACPVPQPHRGGDGQGRGAIAGHESSRGGRAP